MSSFYSASGLHYLCKKKRTMTLDNQTGLVLEGGGMREYLLVAYLTI